MGNETYDIIVVGTGPAGLSVGIEASKNNLTCLLIDKGSFINTIRRYPTYAVFFSTSELLEIGGIPFPSVSKQPTRQEALKYYTKVSEYFNLKFSLYNAVNDIVKLNNGFVVNTQKGLFNAKKVVVATGYYDKYNKLNVPGENLEHVRHFYDEAYHYVGENVLVVGGSNSAGEAALDLYRNGAKVTLVHRGAELYYKMKYWVKPDLENRINEGSIKAYFNSQVVEIKADAVIVKTQSGNVEIECNHVLSLIGYHPDVEFLAKVGIHFNHETFVPVFNDQTLESNIEGLYLAGTVLTGKNTSKIFIENSRHHGKLIVHHILTKH